MTLRLHWTHLTQSRQEFSRGDAPWQGAQILNHSLNPKPQPKVDAASGSGSRSSAGEADHVRHSRESLQQLQDVQSGACSSQSASTVDSVEEGDVRLSQVSCVHARGRAHARTRVSL